jgi:two-component system, chemotaxis family, response regulator Rcp1
MTSKIKPIDILLVEDSGGDVRLIKEALKDGKLNNQLFTVKDGVEAMEFLLKKGKHRDAVRPDLILLDLNLPKKDGREVLAEIKENRDLKRIPVVILSTSNTETDILKTYNLHANCYIVKPLDLDKFIGVVRSIESFWLSIVKLPNGEK